MTVRDRNVLADIFPLNLNFNSNLYLCHCYIVTNLEGVRRQKRQIVIAQYQHFHLLQVLKHVIADLVDVVVGQVQIRQLALRECKIQFDKILIGQRQLHVAVRLVSAQIEPGGVVVEQRFDVFDARHFSLFRVHFVATSAFFFA